MNANLLHKRKHFSLLEPLVKTEITLVFVSSNALLIEDINGDGDNDVDDDDDDDSVFGKDDNDSKDDLDNFNNSNYDNNHGDNDYGDKDGCKIVQLKY